MDDPSQNNNKTRMYNKTCINRGILFIYLMLDFA